VPELPEVETVRRGLESAVVGRRICEVEVRGHRTVRRQTPAELKRRLTGRRFEAARRRGKFLLLGLDDGAVLVIHLRMSGQLLHVAGGAERPELAKHTHVLVSLDDGAQLRFVDPRTFGEWFVSCDIDGRGIPRELCHLGRDPFLEGLPASYLVPRLERRRASLKALLTDQRVVAGIGSIYADEICFRCSLRPDRPGGSLDSTEVTLLAGAVQTVLNEAIRSHGSSLTDLGYRDLEGDLGTYQESHCVYGRATEPCVRCGHPITRLKIGARSAYCCEWCQR